MDSTYVWLNMTTDAPYDYLRGYWSFEIDESTVVTDFSSYGMGGYSQILLQQLV
jgi:hypothetical protein